MSEMKGLQIVLRMLPPDIAGTCGAKSSRHMNSLLEPLGWMGFCLCFACWFPQTVETIRARSCNVNVGFLTLNLSGCVALLAYSLARGDWPFVVLNAVCAGAGGINLWYAFHARPTGPTSIVRRYSTPR